MKTNKYLYILSTNQALVGHLWATVNIMALQDGLLNLFTASNKKVKKPDSLSPPMGAPPGVSVTSMGGGDYSSGR